MAEVKFKRPWFSPDGEYFAPGVHTIDVDENTTLPSSAKVLDAGPSAEDDEDED